jgi:pimeloyl-ACP methyl ester carboxylesterase
MDVGVGSRRVVPWKRLRRFWVGFAIAATVAFAGWSLVAYRANEEARLAAMSGAGVDVTFEDGIWSFRPAKPDPNRASLVFFPGAFVDPVAYAPLMRAAAAEGHAAYLVELPRRGVLGGAEDPQVGARLQSLLGRAGLPRWWVAGHSRGAVIACQVADRAPAGLDGALLIGTTHPRDVDLSQSALDIVKIGGTHDGIARRQDAEANAARLPATTRWVWIAGANHSHFGWYGFQPGDWRADIPADSQRRLLIDAVLAALGGPAILRRESDAKPSRD